MVSMVVDRKEKAKRKIKKNLTFYERAFQQETMIFIEPNEVHSQVIKKQNYRKMIPLKNQFHIKLS